MKKGFKEYLSAILAAVYFVCLMPNDGIQSTGLFSYGKKAALIGFAGLAFLKIINAIKETEGNTIFEKCYVFLKSHVFLFLSLVFCVLIEVLTKQLMPLKAFFIILALADTDFDFQCKAILGGKVLMMMFVLYGYMKNFAPGRIVAEEGKLLQFTLGFANPAVLMAELLGILWLFLYLYRESFTISEFLILNCLNVLGYALTGCTGMMIIFLLCSFGVYLRKKVPFTTSDSWVFIVIVLAVILVPVMFAVLYHDTNPLLYKWNLLMDNRLFMQNQLITEQGIGLIGHNCWELAYFPVEEVWLDQSFIRDLIEYGIIFVSMMTVWISLSVRHLCKKNNVAGILITIGFLCTSVLFYQTMSENIHFALLMISMIVLKTDKELFAGDGYDGV